MLVCCQIDHYELMMSFCLEHVFIKSINIGTGSSNRCISSGNNSSLYYNNYSKNFSHTALWNRNSCAKMLINDICILGSLVGTILRERSIEWRSRALEYRQSKRGSENITNRVGGTRTPLQLAYKLLSVLYPHLFFSRLSSEETFALKR